MKIAIDKGHNRGQDQGAAAIGNENIMNVQTGDKVIAKLKAQRHDVLDIITQMNNNVTVEESLAERVSIANNWGADLYVSIHANACPGGHGAEVWCGSSSSVDIATRIVNNIATLGFTNRGVKIQGQNGYEHLYVLNNTTMKALLVEQCFVDCAADMAAWNSESMANAIVAGINGQAVQVQSTIQQSVAKPEPYPTYDETIPVGPNIYQIPNMPFYIEKRNDGDMSIHLDRGNYITLRKGGAPEVYWNNNKGAGGSKRLF